ncbi:AbrB/MazE/SpoVT family DNA-binding domain-containing protein [Halodesulfurarchaeum sp.]|uniref:AbrB/MazE/SpoVT family DNA-binding domain-containing protein n=1 Tax=Halodesulfurarchaeum sp. TaxID=1980530 RepID=UPI002FC298CB
MAEYTRKVGDRGQITIPKELRERYGIEGGDDVGFVEVGEEIRITPPSNKERMAQGYRRHADRSKELAEEMGSTSSEAGRSLGDAPRWSE